MISRFRQGIALILSLFLMISIVPAAQAAESCPEAQDISGTNLITSTVGPEDCSLLFDGSIADALLLPDRSRLTLEHSGGIGSIYIKFDMEYGPCTITNNDTGRAYWFGTEGFLHSFWDLEAVFGTAPTSISIRFAQGSAQVVEMQVFSPGQVPDSIQKWSQAKTAATDMILFATHGDDDQLFFAGLLPYYAGELDYEVLVVYLTGHLNKTTVRRHEMLDGLWTVGVDTYPVFGSFIDYYTESMNGAYREHKRRGETKEMLQEFVMEQVRRYKPLIAVGHDIRGGEYGHGQHMMYADLMVYAVENAGNPEVFPALAERWGTWEVPKTYIHMWRENEIIMDWDQPLSRFDGMTAYQVTKYLGFAQHVSQKENFWWYLKDEERSDEFVYISPREYGLYRSTVGPDEIKQDMFENVTPYGLQATGNAS